jgi:putative MATE family efflux protein
MVKTVWAVSLPILFVQISETLLYVTDTAFLARVGTTELAALALADTLLQFWTVPVAGLIEAMVILIARRAGQGRHGAVGRTFNLGLLLVAAVSLPLVATLKLASPALATRVGGSNGVGTALDAFLQIAAFGIIFFSLSLAISSLDVGLARTRVLAWASLVLVITNLALSYVLIFGQLGLPRLGMEGAALGELGAEVATCAFLAGCTFWRRDLRRYELACRGVWDAALTRSLVRMAVPISLQALLEGGRWFAFFLIVENLGEEALAWSSIIFACYEVLLIPSVAFAETTFAMVSRLIGQTRRETISRLARQLIVATYLLTLPLVTVGLLFPHLTLSLFTSDSSVVAASVGSLRVIVVSMVIVIPAEIWSAAVSGTGDTDAALGIEVALTGVLLGAAFVAGPLLHLALAWVWLSIPLAWGVSLVLSYAWVRSGFWERR